MKKKNQLNLNLPSDLDMIFTQIAKERKISPARLGHQIITQYIEFYHTKILRGDITISTEVLKNVLELVDKSKLNEIAKLISNEMYNKIKFQEGEVNYAILVERMKKWNAGNSLQFNEIERDTYWVFSVMHKLGTNWSDIESRSYEKLFNKIGMRVLETEFDDTTFTIKVEKNN